ncbi:hypothetical protein A4G19_05130 [Pasteurellaceae bacterium Macca]|nr:hypothetical protein [Pasteurellaceae bacterium Macca]
MLTPKKRFDANKVELVENGYPYVVRTALNNGVKGYLNEDETFLNERNTISFGQDTATIFYQEKPYFTGDKIKVMKFKKQNFNKKNAQFFLPAMSKAFRTFSWGSSSFSVSILAKVKVWLPVTQNNEINLDFMENFVAELEAQRSAELENYLSATGLADYVLTAEEQNALENYSYLNWQQYNLEYLFGKSIRGKRLKSADRISGNLPFVTAGETDEGISAFIGNDVTIFPKNTTTIDMFGSAKYRNYEYGADDHIAVVHTQDLKKMAALFITSAIHKASYTGKFSYSRNFYAKDADELDIWLPEKDGKPDYDYMVLLVSAVQKLVIKDVVLYADEKIRATKQVIAR